MSVEYQEFCFWRPTTTTTPHTPSRFASLQIARDGGSQSLVCLAPWHLGNKKPMESCALIQLERGWTLDFFFPFSTTCHSLSNQILLMFVLLCQDMQATTLREDNKGTEEQTDA